MKKNLYTHEIELKNLKIKNRPREEFRKLLEKVMYRGYEVEQLADGRKIVITKPGGKFVYGKVKREDFMVWVYNPIDSTLWLISHKDIYSDLEDIEESVYKRINALKAQVNYHIKKQKVEEYRRRLRKK